MGWHQDFSRTRFLSSVRLGIPSSAKQLDHLSITKGARWLETSRYLKTSGYFILHPDVWRPLSAACYLWLNNSKEAFGQEVSFLHQFLLRIIMFGKKKSVCSSGNKADAMIFFSSVWINQTTSGKKEKLGDKKQMQNCPAVQSRFNHVQLSSWSSQKYNYSYRHPIRTGVQHWQFTQKVIFKNKSLLGKCR